MSSFLAADYLALDDSRLCKAISVCIHYFLLSSFGWMLVEAVYQYMTYVVVVGASSYKSRFMRKAAPLAWGLPLIPIIALLIYDSSLYLGQPNFCWMGLNEVFYGAVLAPLAAVLLTNVIIYIIILKSVLCFKVNLRTNQSQATRTLYQLRLALCVFFLLGISWIFGFLTIVPEAHFVFAYLFCIFSSFQGFAIFVFFVLRERNARKLWTEFASVSDDHNSFSNARKTYAYPSGVPTNVSTNHHLSNNNSTRISCPKKNSKYFY
jgi:G protein-coupled receptor 64/G protein-coupled receptor 126